MSALPPDMTEATRLTREGRLAEAAALLQRLFQGETAPAAAPAVLTRCRSPLRPVPLLPVYYRPGRAGPRRSLTETAALVLSCPNPRGAGT